VVTDGLYAFILRSPRLHNLEQDGRYALHAHFDLNVPCEFLIRGWVRRVDGVTRTALAPDWGFGVLLADRADLNLVAERTTISVRRSTWSVGSDASEEDAALLRGAAPNRESAARTRAALARPVVDLDRLAVTRPDARLRNRSAELVRPEEHRSTDEIVAEI
jgi:hypothetical protein